MPDFVILGCGYVGARLAARLPGRVTALTRSEAGAARLRAQGHETVAWDLDSAPGMPLPVAVTGSILFYLVPPPGGQPADPRLRASLQRLGGPPSRLVYMSTTGVYGDAGGEAVNEDTPPAPATDRSRARLDAELAVREWCGARGSDWVVLRVPGIYGPGRLPLERLRRGDPLLPEAECGPGNRIHVDDLVSVCLAAAQSAAARNRIYNVGDGNHSSTTHYFTTVARLAGLPQPPVVARERARERLSPAAWSYLAESRRVDTTRMARELGVEIRYPDLERGILASL